MYVIKDSKGNKIGEYEELDDVLTFIKNKSYEYDLTEEFDSYINNTYPTVEICGYLFDPSYVLRQVHNTAYIDSYRVYVDRKVKSMIDDLKNEVAQLENGKHGEFWMTGDTVTYIKDEEVELEL